MTHPMTPVAGDAPLRSLHAENCPVRPHARERDRSLGEQDGGASAREGAGEAVAPRPRRRAASV